LICNFRTRAPLSVGVILVLLFALLACDKPSSGSAVGLSRANYADPQRQSWTDNSARPLYATIWYPAAPGSPRKEWTVAIFRGGPSAHNAPLAAGAGKLPLVLLSHGTGGSSVSMAWLAQALASRGYIVAAVDHHGNTAVEPDYLHQGFALWWERAQDLSVLLDRMLADPRFASRVDPERVGVAGFSLGGYTALAMVGARVDHDRWREFCATQPADPGCRTPPESKWSMSEVLAGLEKDENARQSIGRSGNSYRDKRVRAAFVIAPVLAAALSPESLSAMDAPVHIVVGEKDDQAIPAGNAQVLARLIPNARLEIAPGVTHYMFLAPCTLVGKVVAYPICTDPGGTDRAQLHAATAQRAAGFFDAALKTR
jgi:predicted dienelactone hydrolase